MKKNNATLVIAATTLIMISASIQGMKREDEQQIIITNTDTTTVHKTFIKQDIFHAHITMSPASQYPKNITMCYYGPSIMTALYAKYKSGAQFAGVTNCRLSDFLSNFQKVSADLKELCRATTQQNNIKNLTRVTFWYLMPENLSARLSDLARKHYEHHKSEIFKMVRDHYYGIQLAEKETDYYVFEDTNKEAQLKVTLYPEEGTIELGGNDETKL